MNPPVRGKKRLDLVLGLATALISLFVSTIFSNNLLFSILQFTNKTKFNITDSIFNKDVWFYMFSLPLIKEITGLLFLVILMMIILTIGLCIFLFTFRKSSQEAYQNQNVFDMDGRLVGNTINRFLNMKSVNNTLFQTGILGSLIFTILGINYFINTYELLYSPRGCCLCI